MSASLPETQQERSEINTPNKAIEPTGDSACFLLLTSRSPVPCGSSLALGCLAVDPMECSWQGGTRVAIPPEFSYANKDEFTQKFLIPLLQRLDFSLVINYHGRAEFGNELKKGHIFNLQLIASNT